MKNTSGLGAPWKPGQSGNPGGRPKGSLYFNEAVRMLSGKTEDELRAIADNPNERALVRGVSLQYLDSIDRDNPKTRGEAFDRIANRLEGKPAQTIVNQDPQQVVFTRIDFQGGVRLGEDDDAPAVIDVTETRRLASESKKNARG